MAEDLDNGSDGIIANKQWIHFASCPPGRFLRMNFQFNAAWANRRQERVDPCTLGLV